MPFQFFLHVCEPSVHSLLMLLLSFLLDLQDLQSHFFIHFWFNLASIQIYFDNFKQFLKQFSLIFAIFELHLFQKWNSWKHTTVLKTKKFMTDPICNVTTPFRYGKSQPLECTDIEPSHSLDVLVALREKNGRKRMISCHCWPSSLKFHRSLTCLWPSPISSPKCLRIS